MSARIEIAASDRASRIAGIAVACIAHANVIPIAVFLQQFKHHSVLELGSNGIPLQVSARMKRLRVEGRSVRTLLDWAESALVTELATSVVVNGCFGSGDCGVAVWYATHYKVTVPSSLIRTPVAQHESGIKNRSCWHGLGEVGAESYNAKGRELKSRHHGK